MKRHSCSMVIKAPEGDVGANLGWLRDLMALDIGCLATGHGLPFLEPRYACKQSSTAALKPKAKLLAALPAQSEHSIVELPTHVYSDAPPHLHTMARRSLQEHLVTPHDHRRLAKTPSGCWIRT